MPNKTKKHWLVLLICCGFAGSALGLNMNVMGVFHQPVAEDLNMLVGTFAVQTTLGALLLSIVGLFVNRILQYISFKTMSLIGVVLASASLMAMAFVSTPALFYLLGIIRGTGAGLIGIVSYTMLLNNWFDEKNGLALSISASFAGLVGVIFSPILTSLIQSYGWRMTFIFTGILFILFNLPIIFIPVKLEPRDEGLLPYGYQEVTTTGGGDYQVHKSKPSYTGLPFLSIFFMSLLFPFAVGLAQNLPGIALSNGFSIELGAFLISACMLANIAFKLVLGPTASKIGVVNVVYIVTIILVAGLLMINYGGSAWMLVIGSFLFGINYFVPSIALAMLSRRFFGKYQSNKVYPIFAFLSGASSAFAVSVIGFIYDFTQSYSAAIWTVIACVVLPVIFLFFASQKAKQNQAKEA